MNSTIHQGVSCLSDISFTDSAFIQGELNVPGLVGILVFYAAIFAVGIYASWRSRKRQTTSNEVMLANRDMHEIIGVFTLTATWVGGDYVNGTSEYLITPGYGLIWCQAPIFFSAALITGSQLRSALTHGIFIAPKMWKAGYVTMLDPFAEKFGELQTSLLYIAALFAEVSFAALAFSVLGSSLNVIVGISFLWAVIISALIALLYTLMGGLSSVAYTDVLQLAGIVFGLILAIPFAMNHPAVEDIWTTAKSDSSWLGEVPTGPYIGLYIDTALLLFFGAIPWQIYYQRAFSQKSAENARRLSVIAGFVAIIVAIPPVFVGAIAASTDWNMTAYREIGSIPMPACDYPLALPLVMRFLTPTVVGVVGLGAVSAAVMSSTDSCILSSSSMFAHNVYKPIRNMISAKMGRNTRASDREIVWVLRVAMFGVAGVTTVVAVTVKSIMALIMLQVDIPYCLLFPQLICVLFVPIVNSYGSFVGLLVATFLRLAGGEYHLHLPTLIKFPWYDEELHLQLFPFKTIVTVLHFILIISVSWITKLLHEKCTCFQRLDKHLFDSFQQDHKHLKTDEGVDEELLEYKNMKNKEEDITNESKLLTIQLNLQT